MIFAVTTTMIDRKGGNVWWFLDIPEHDNIADLEDALVNDGVLLADKLRVEPIGDGSRQRRIVSREPFILGKSIVATITPAHIDIIG